MITAESFLTALRTAGFGIFSGVPCSYLTPLINAVIDAPDLHYVGAANEGDAVAVACGAELGGRRGVVLFQNSGLGNAVNPLTSLTYTFRLPVLVIVTWRGQPGGPSDEPQHELMGRITPQLLETMQIPWESFPTEEDQVASVVQRSLKHMAERATPYALIMPRGAVADQVLRSQPRGILPDGAPPARPELSPRFEQQSVLAAIQANVESSAAVLATTGFTGRALFALDDRPNQFYMVGSMGCLSSLGLGLAVAQPQRTVWALDGDGALLMRMGALATIGHYRPPNLVHVLLDNGVHESTGGQATVSGSVDWAAVAQACGYPRVVRIQSLAQLKEELQTRPRQLTFLHVCTIPQPARKLPRPEKTPAEMALRFRKWLGTAHAST